MEFLVVLKKFQWSIKGVSMVFTGCFKSYLFQTCNYDNFIFISGHEPYPVDVDKKGSNINTLHMRTGL